MDRENSTLHYFTSKWVRVIFYRGVIIELGHRIISGNAHKHRSSKMLKTKKPSNLGDLIQSLSLYYWWKGNSSRVMQQKGFVSFSVVNTGTRNFAAFCVFCIGWKDLLALPLLILFIYYIIFVDVATGVILSVISLWRVLLWSNGLSRLSRWWFFSSWCFLCQSAQRRRTGFGQLEPV